MYSPNYIHDTIHLFNSAINRSKADLPESERESWAKLAAKLEKLLSDTAYVSESTYRSFFKPYPLTGISIEG